MKKISIIILLAIVTLCMNGCYSTKNTAYVGLNAEIVEIPSEIKGLVVKGLDQNSILGERSYINCESQDIYFIYADNKTAKTMHLQFEDLVVGDEITIDVNSVENKYALASRIQLITQRK